MKATVFANEESFEVELPCSVQSFLESRGLRSGGVVVELNGEAVTPSEFGRRQLAAEDRMQIVRVVAGG